MSWNDALALPRSFGRDWLGWGAHPVMKMTCAAGRRREGLNYVIRGVFSFGKEPVKQMIRRETSPSPRAWKVAGTPTSPSSDSSEKRLSYAAAVASAVSRRTNPRRLSWAFVSPMLRRWSTTSRAERVRGYEFGTKKRVRERCMLPAGGKRCLDIIMLRTGRIVEGDGVGVHGREREPGAG